MIRVLVLATVCASLGCASVYTDIHKVDDNNYFITRTKQGFFSTHGTVYQCQPIGTSGDLRCTEIDTP